MASELNLLFAVSEFEGIVKTGGLADVAAALVKQLTHLGHRVKVFMPAYREARAKVESTFISKGAVALNYQETLLFALRHGQFDGIDLYLIEYNDLFDRAGIYDEGGKGYHDNDRRFAFFCKAVLESCEIIQFTPNIIHCHDWPTALLPYYLKVDACHNPFFNNTTTLLTIHNAAYQHKMSSEQLDSLGIGWRFFNPACFEDVGMLNLLKGGIAFSDRINTVSPGYAEELLTIKGSHGLFESFKRREKDFSGILNGCDYQQWNPESDPLIPAHFSVEDLSGKQHCKRLLQEHMGLSAENEVPVYGLVSRLTEQKGFAYLIPALRVFLQQPVQVILLGSGDKDIASQLHHLAESFPDKCRFYEGFENSLAHRIEAGSDFFLMPSLFEPCGLNQMYSLRYATLPIIRKVGGLKDTVRCYEDAGSQATGFGFINPNQDDLLNSMNTSFLVYQNADELYQLRKNAITMRFDWETSVDGYLSIYRSMTS